MSARTDKRREGIIALTQTEIMLVLAVVILLLLLAKGFDLTESQKELEVSQNKLEDAQRRITLLVQQTGGGSVEEQEQRQEKVDMSEKITEILKRGGVVNDGGDKERRLGENPAEDVRVLVDEKKRKDEMDKTIDRVLARAGKPPPDNNSRDDLDADAEVKAKKDELIRLSENAAKAEAEADDLRRENKELKATISAMEEAGKEKDDGAQGKSLGDKIGCEPCWRGSGKRLYYFAYNITYSGGAYKISQHRDLRGGAGVVGKALGGLPSLRDYPEGWVSRETFLSFGRRLAKEKNKLHGEECQLAVTINDEASGKVIKFIRDEAGFCPILR